MSNVNKETIADIINEKRTTAREIRSKTPNQYGLELAVMLEAEADRIEAALSEPLRNCDVGTPEEQSKRHREWCRQARWVSGCIRCMAEWLQLQYVRELQTTGEVVK